MPRRIAIVGGGVSGLAAAWALNHQPDRFDFRLFEARGPDRRKRDYRRYAAGWRRLDPLRHLRHRLHTVGVPAHAVVDGEVRHRTGRYQVQLQREVRRPRLCARLRLRPQGRAATGDREVSTHPEAAAPVRVADPRAVEVPELDQSVQLRQHGNAPEPGGVLRGLQVQGAEADVRQLSHGDERVRHACGPFCEVPRVLRHRVRDANADVGPGHEAASTRT